MAVQYIQCAILGYGKERCTVLGGYDPDSGILNISKISGYTKERFGECVIVSNDLKMDHRDHTFTEKDFPRAVSAFFELLDGVSSDGQTGRLIFSKPAERARPTLEKGVIDQQGQNYRIPENITNAQMAVLCMAWHAATTIDYADTAMDLFGELASMQYAAHGYSLDAGGNSGIFNVFSV